MYHLFILSCIQTLVHYNIIVCCTKTCIVNIVYIGKPSKSKKSKKSFTTLLKPDHTHLLFDYHKVAIATLALVQDIAAYGREVRGLLVGLGGGALPMYMGRMLDKVR